MYIEIEKTERENIMNIKRFKQSQLFRVFFGNGYYYVTAKQIRAGFSSEWSVNVAAQQCLDALELQRSADRISPIGLAGIWQNVNIQLDVQ